MLSTSKQGDDIFFDLRLEYGKTVKLLIISETPFNSPLSLDIISKFSKCIPLISSRTKNKELSNLFLDDIIEDEKHLMKLPILSYQGKKHLENIKQMKSCGESKGKDGILSIPKNTSVNGPTVLTISNPTPLDLRDLFSYSHSLVVTVDIFELDSIPKDKFSYTLIETFKNKNLKLLRRFYPLIMGRENKSVIINNKTGRCIMFE